jgi:hypothetical protein
VHDSRVNALARALALLVLGDREARKLRALARRLRGV